MGQYISIVFIVYLNMDLSTIDFIKNYALKNDFPKIKLSWYYNFSKPYYEYQIIYGLTHTQIFIKKAFKNYFFFYLKSHSQQWLINMWDTFNKFYFQIIDKTA